MSRIRIKRSSEEPLYDEPEIKRPRTEPVSVSISCFPTAAAVRSAKVIKLSGVISTSEEADDWSDSEQKLFPQVAAFLTRSRPVPANPVVPVVAPAPAGTLPLAAPPGALVLRSGEQMYGIRHTEISSAPADRPPAGEAIEVHPPAGTSVISPFAARWFVWEGASEVERRTATRTGIWDFQRYVELRNKLISAYRRAPLQYLSVRGARELTGESDISFLVRVWAISDYLGLVNFSCDPASTPKQARRMFDWQTASLASREREGLVQCDCCGKTLHFTAHFARLHGICLCTRCFSAGRFPHGLTEEHFNRMEDLAMDENAWTEEDTLTLLEAIERFGENDWSAIAAHVKKPVASCLVHFASLPIEDRFTEPLVPTTETKTRRANPFADLDNPVMTLLSFLSSTVHPVVASAAAKRVFDSVAGGQTGTSELYEEALAGASEQASKLQKIEENNIASLFPKIIDLKLKQLELKHMRLHKLIPGPGPAAQNINTSQ